MSKPVFPASRGRNIFGGSEMEAGYVGGMESRVYERGGQGITKDCGLRRSLEFTPMKSGAPEGFKWGVPGSHFYFKIVPLALAWRVDGGWGTHVDAQSEHRFPNIAADWNRFDGVK